MGLGYKDIVQDESIDVGGLLDKGLSGCWMQFQINKGVSIWGTQIQLHIGHGIMAL